MPAQWLKNRLLMAAFVSIFTVTLLGGCASTVEEHPGATSGAVIGAVGGAVLGGIIGHQVERKEEGMIIGAILGALAGATIGHYAYDVKRSRAETASLYSYKPTSGPLIRIEDVAVIPRVVRPGEKVDLQATYAVLHPDPDARIGIIEIREIRRNGVLIGRPSVKVVRTGGTYTSVVPLFLPANARPGTYTVITTIDGGIARDTRETTFTVE